MKKEYETPVIESLSLAAKSAFMWEPFNLSASYGEMLTRDYGEEVEVF